MAIREDHKKNKNDLGLGDKVGQENRTRFVNHDGSLNVHRKGVFDRGNFSPYHAILNVSWARFNIGIVLYYLLANLLFAFLYLMTGRESFPDISQLNAGQRFGQLFFYSVQVITTLGSSPLKPATTLSHVVLAIEAMAGMLGFALAATLMFARFSNPAVKILFSDKAVIAPYEEGKGFMARIINGRNNELIEVSATLTLAINNQKGLRDFYQLPLERDKVLTFPVNWTIVHPIDADSPLFGKTLNELYASGAEFVLSIAAVDPDLSKKVYARRSYKGQEIINGKFSYILERDEEGTVVVDPSRISEIDKV